MALQFVVKGSSTSLVCIQAYVHGVPPINCLADTHNFKLCELTCTHSHIICTIDDLAEKICYMVQLMWLFIPSCSHTHSYSMFHMHCFIITILIIISIPYYSCFILFLLCLYMFYPIRSRTESAECQSSYSICIWH